MSEAKQKLETASIDRDWEIALSEVNLKEEFTKPGIANVTPEDIKKLKGILAKYRSARHPFTECKRDQMKHGLSEDHANRRCAVLKQLTGRK
jgi:hypothetical protein